MSNPYLRRRVMEILHTDHLESDLKDLSLNMLMTAFAEMVADNGDNPPQKMETNSLAKHYAGKLISDKFVVFRDPDDNRIYYTAAHGNDLVAVFYPLGISYDRYCAIGSSPTVLASLDITTPNFTDHVIIDRIFRLSSENKEISAIDTPVGVIDPARHVHWQWHIPGSKVPKEIAQAVQEHREGRQPELEVIVPSVAAPSNNDRIVELTQGAGQTAMSQAFLNANQTRGDERRDGDRRDHSERREFSPRGGGKPNKGNRHYESPGEQASRQAAIAAEPK